MENKQANKPPANGVVKEVLNSKLTQYSAMAGAFMAGGMAADAQCLVYRDIDPDVDITASGIAAGFDIDQDGTNDFYLQVQTGYYGGTLQYGVANVFLPPGNTVAGSLYTYGASTFPTPYALNANAPIDPDSIDFQPNTGTALEPQYLGLNIGNAVTVGNWINQQDKYLGVGFQSGTDTLYGWVRLSVDVSNPAAPTIRIKDLAHNPVPNGTIRAGEVSDSAGLASNVFGADVADNNNGQDLQVSFNKAADESGISEYRIIVVKEADAASFTLADAQAVGLGNYSAVTPVGIDISTVLTTNANDKDGDPIQNNQAYQIFVMSVADGVNADCDVLSDPSATVTLTPAGAVAADVATTVTATDVADNQNGSDMEVAFTKAADESGIEFYRIITVKAADSASFNLSAAETVTDYKEVAPTGSNIAVTLDAAATDKDGDPIVENQPYNVFILSMADGTNATLNALSDPSNQVTLTSTVDINEQVLEEATSAYTFNNTLFVNLKHQKQLNATISLIAVDGQKVLQTEVSNGLHQFDLSHLPTGLYVVSIDAANVIISRKVMVE